MSMSSKEDKVMNANVSETNVDDKTAASRRRKPKNGDLGGTGVIGKMERSKKRRGRRKPKEGAQLEEGKKSAKTGRKQNRTRRSNGGKQRATDPFRRRLSRQDKFPKSVRIAPERLKELDTGAALLQPEKAKTLVAKKRLAKKKHRFVERIARTARAEILNQQPTGYIEPEEGVPSYMIRQTEICDAVDIASATKRFGLDLCFGPYRLDYTQNGRHILLGGRKGHVAAFDWMTKDLRGEMNVMESVRDIQWLHVETMYAVAQKRWVRIYDVEGTELHCLKSMFDIKRLDFLPRHLLLVASSNNTFLHWLDISIGKMVASFPTGHGALDVLAHNPANAVVLTGNTRGTVSMWSPNCPKKPLVEMLAHKGSVLGIAVEGRGHLMATTGLDKRLRIWDVRNYKELHAYHSKCPTGYSHVAFSQRNCIAVAVDNVVQVFNDAHLETATAPYLMHRCDGVISDLQFCPFEDVLGVGHERGFDSLLIPGSGDSNFDALRANPFESKGQRREREVRMLLDKLQPELISLDPAAINRVDRKGLRDTMDYKANVMHIRPSDIADADG